MQGFVSEAGPRGGLAGGLAASRTSSTRIAHTVERAGTPAPPPSDRQRVRSRTHNRDSIDQFCLGTREGRPTHVRSIVCDDPWERCSSEPHWAACRKTWPRITSKPYALACGPCRGGRTGVVGRAGSRPMPATPRRDGRRTAGRSLSPAQRDGDLHRRQGTRRTGDARGHFSPPDSGRVELSILTSRRHGYDVEVAPIVVVPATTRRQRSRGPCQSDRPYLLRSQRKPKAPGADSSARRKIK